MSVIPHPTIAEAEPALPEIVPFEDIRAPAYQPGMLPAPLEDWAADVAERMDCAPVDMAAACAVVAAGFAIGRHCAIQPKQADSAYLRWPLLWGMIVAPSGVKKTPTIDQMCAPLYEQEAQRRKAIEQEHAMWAARIRTARLDMRAAEKRYEAARKSRDSEAEQQALMEMADAELRMNEPEPTGRLIVTDTSYEALEDIMAHVHRGLLLKVDETAHFLRRLDEERRATERGFYLWSWQPGSPYVIDRKTRNARPAKGGLAVLGATQPDAIRNYIQAVNAGTGSNDGLLQRFQVMVMPEIRHASYVDRPINEAARRAYEAAIAELFRYDWADADTQRPHVFRFSDDAQARYRQWSEAHIRAVTMEQKGSAYSSHLAKYDTLVTALALIFELVENPFAKDVSLGSLERAITYSDYLKGHAEAIYGIAQPQHVRDARALLEKALEGTSKALTGTITVRTCQQARLLGRGVKSERYKAAILELATRSYLIPIDRDSSYGWHPHIRRRIPKG